MKLVPPPGPPTAPKRLRFGLGFACLAILLTVGLAACDTTVIVERGCPATCEEENPVGLYYFQNVASTCACEGCSDACTESVCYRQETPDDTCLPCVQEALSGDPCLNHAGLFGSGCWSYDECTAFVACLVACDS
jgi:hypothetical protein